MLLFDVLAVALLATSCSPTEEAPYDKDTRVVCDNNCVCSKLNDNVQFVAAVVRNYVDEGGITSFSSAYVSGQNDTYTFTFSGRQTVRYSDVSYEAGAPALSIYQEKGEYYWAINGCGVPIGKDELLKVTNDTLYPMFEVADNGSWQYSVGGIDWRPVPEANVAVGASPLRASLSPNGDFLVCSANDSLQLVVPTNYLHYTLKNDVPLQGFYKDIFLDAGLYLTTRSTIPAATYLGYKLESVSCSKEADTAWQNSVIGGSADDENGRLLYPDGQPRYKILFVNGGNSRSHGQSLNPRCLQNMRTFVASGGSYVGTCAGAFFASSGYDSILDYPYYLHLWPGTMNHTGLADSSTGLFVDPGSPLLKYYTFGNDHYVANVRHNKGGYPVTWPVGTELLARYDCPALPSIHEKPAAWAYKKDDKTGRVVLEGSHPEEVTSGERRDFTAAMIKYAGDGVGVTKIKGLLRNGESRVMDGLTSGRGRINSKIGDRQYHHFAVYVPDGARKITFSVSSPVDCNMQLTICNSTYAYQDKATYKTSESGSIQSLNFENLPSGLWYVAVRLLTTVTAGDTDKGQVYSGRTDVLNGVPYTVTVSWLP